MRYQPRLVENWLRREFASVVPTTDGDDLRVNCPFCERPDSKHHLYVSIVKPVAHCFRCEWSGTHLQLVMERTGSESYAEAWHWLEGPGVQIAGFTTITERIARLRQSHKECKKDLEMPDWFESFDDADWQGFHARLVYKYAKQRLGIGNIVFYGIGCCQKPDNRDWRYRMIIPVERGLFQGRIIGDGKPKYLSPVMERRDRLFNFPALRRAGLRLFVAEGAISAMALGWSAVAVLGSRATQDQMERIAEARAPMVVIAFDAGTAFSKSVLEMADYFAGCGKEVIVRQYSEGDPDSCDVWQDEVYGLKYKVRARMV